MEEKNKKQNRNLSAFQISAIVLIVLFFVAIVAQICVLIVLKNKTDDLNNKNEEVTIEQIVDYGAEDNLSEFLTLFEHGDASQN